MGNLADIPDERLEEMPRRAAFKEGKSEPKRHYNNYFYPYQRMKRFLTSRLGKSVDVVFSDFVHADWVSKEFRNYLSFGRSIELDTFCKGHDIFFYSFSKPIKLSDTWGDTFYVHPKSRVVCLHKSKKHRDWLKDRRDEQAKTMKILGDYHQLLKLEGIWYEVKGAPWAKFYYINGIVKHDHTKPMLSCNAPTSPYCGRPRIVSKRQLSSRELVKLGLKNDNKEPSSKLCPICGGDRCTHFYSQLYKQHKLI
jgi:hypothetical protein